LYQLEEAGLSTNTIDGTAGNVNFVGQVMSDLTGNNSALNKIGNWTQLSEKTWAGKGMSGLFSNIDTTSRQTLAMHYMDEGLSVQEAAIKANNLYADMEVIAPQIVEFVDNYGLGLFAKWFMGSGYGLRKLAQENPTRFIVMMSATLALEEYLNNSIEEEGFDATEKWYAGGFDITGKSAPTALFEYMYGTVYKDLHTSYTNYQNIKNEATTKREAAIRALAPYLLPGIISKQMTKGDTINFSEKSRRMPTPAQFLTRTLFSKAGTEIGSSKSKKFRLDTRGAWDMLGDNGILPVTSFNPNKKKKKSPKTLKWKDY